VALAVVAWTVSRLRAAPAALREPQLALAAALAALPRRTEAQERVSRRLDALLATMPR
jgi:hypothetical protein